MHITAFLAHAGETFINPPDNRQENVGKHEANDKRWKTPAERTAEAAHLTEREVDVC
jgi:hypothetical protein